MSEQKEILILGSTGSIGVNTLNVIREFPEKFKVTGLTVNTNIADLEKQIEEFNPSYVVVTDKSKADELKKRINIKCEVLSGKDGLIEIAKNLNYDIIVTALVGFAGLSPTIEGIKRKKRIALANKETLVVAGELITDMIYQFGSELIPVDSEHSAIFQCLIGEEKEYIDKLILTASGGPFLNLDKESLSKVTVEQALAHPNWKMGSKITIDSATMMNKGLEVIEAHWLFGLPKERIEVVVHPQSIIHSMVEFIDGSIKAQLSLPDMKLPIQYALSFPERFGCDFVETKLPRIRELTFFEPDFEKFECLKLAYEVMTAGGTSPCILNAANEIAVDKFLKGKIHFTDIPLIIKSSLDKIENHRTPDLETIFECDRQTREYAEHFFDN
ncbi:MAG: 1-deoxy-D-xylulose-5-phosphate reductoisomerase [Melioribacteraceae bacterium]|nr:MAG: 1-deoxy-D-xylulose-5-phosphate reductoisomerase [Melioribacteraceae bacterium]